MPSAKKNLVKNIVPVLTLRYLFSSFGQILNFLEGYDNWPVQNKDCGLQTVDLR